MAITNIEDEQLKSKLIALIDKQVEQRLDAIRAESHNMVDGVDSPPQSSDDKEGVVSDIVIEDEDAEEVNSSDPEFVDFDEDDQHVFKKRKTSDQASTAKNYTVHGDSDLTELESEKLRLTEEIAMLKAQKKDYYEGKKEPNPMMKQCVEYAKMVVARVGKNFTFSGDEEDSHMRFSKYDEFRSKLGFAITSLSGIDTETREMSIREAMFSILKGSAFAQYQLLANQGLEIEQVLKAMDKAYGFRTDLPMLIKKALGSSIYDDRCKDGTHLARAHINWSKIEELTKGWTVQKFIFEFMKGQVLGTETSRVVSTFTECGVTEFFDALFDFDRHRNSNVSEVSAVSMVGDGNNNYAVNAVQADPRKRTGRAHAGKRTRTPKSYESLWNALALKRNIENTEANKKIAKDRFSVRVCLYCGKGGHSGFGCSVPEADTGYFRG